MSDVFGDRTLWNKMIDEFREFAQKVDCEVVYKKFPDGKETLRLMKWFRPKGVSNAKNS